jgi:hypothetical protein
MVIYYMRRDAAEVDTILLIQYERVKYDYRRTEIDGNNV